MTVSKITTIPAKAKKVAKPKPPAIQKVEHQGDTYISVKSAPEDIRNTILNVLKEVMGFHKARNYDYTYPVDALIGIRDNIVSEFADYSEDITDSKNKFHNFLAIVDEFAVLVKEQLKDKIARGSIEFGDIPYLLEKGTHVSTIRDGHKIGGVVDSVQFRSSFMGVYYEVKMNVISNVFGHIADLPYKAVIGGFTGLKNIDELAVSPISDEEKQSLISRGEKFRKYANGAHYIQYTGQLVRSSWYGSRAFRADGRAMLDVSSFSQVDNNQYSSEGYQSGIEEAREDRANKINLEIKDEDLWRTYPFVYGFSLASKQWGRMALDGVSEIKFREDAFEKLVLPEEDKELVKAIVSDDGGDFSDLIDGKGGGSIFLLHGPPGQGKTLTAEAIAEELKRPLYSISVGELGTSPDSLEETLREILDVSTVWNSVLLLDEADIFLEERDEKDIVRNAMVGVFLRLLEYHQGVMFLTTNRVRNIDNAFYSRISIGLRFGDATVEKRKAIWTNLTKAAGLEGLDLDSLAEHDLNGRQIKNVIKLSLKLARAKTVNAIVDNAMVESVIKRTGQFSKEGQGDNDNGR